MNLLNIDVVNLNLNEHRNAMLFYAEDILEEFGVRKPDREKLENSTTVVCRFDFEEYQKNQRSGHEIEEEILERLVTAARNLCGNKFVFNKFTWSITSEPSSFIIMVNVAEGA